MRRSVSVLLFLSLVCSLAFCSCKSKPADFTVSVKSAGGALFEDAGVRIYADEGFEDLVWAADLDENGSTSFTGTENTAYYAVLENIPVGYDLKESYIIENTTSEIILESSLLPESALSEKSFKLGDVFCDFTVTDCKGITYTLSELLETKKAVVLNFWFLNCDPCKMEFPFLNQAYADYSETIEVIAINPMDGNDEKISAFAEDNSITFPMAKGEDGWKNAFGLTAYPTTVVIDRYGTVAMMHTGYLTSKEDFTKIFDYFTADDYTQSVIKNLSDIETN